VRILDVLHPDAIVANLGGRTGPEVLAELSRPVAAATGLDPAHLQQTLLDRERLGSTSVGDGVAIPHGRLVELPALTAAFGRSTAGIDFKGIDGKPVHLFMALFAPQAAASSYVQVLARVSRLFRGAAFRAAILAAPDAEAIRALIEAEDARE
jgi:PTS system nitrogen regulatory IIA component